MSITKCLCIKCRWPVFRVEKVNELTIVCDCTNSEATESGFGIPLYCPWDKNHRREDEVSCAGRASCNGYEKSENDRCRFVIQIKTTASATGNYEMMEFAVVANERDIAIKWAKRKAYWKGVNLFNLYGITTDVMDIWERD